MNEPTFFEGKGDIELESDSTELVCYANIAKLMISNEEVIFNFGLRDPSNPNNGKALARIYLTHSHAKRISIVLAKSLAAYESQFGEIVTDPLAKLTPEQLQALKKDTKGKQ